MEHRHRRRDARYVQDHRAAASATLHRRPQPIVQFAYHGPAGAFEQKPTVLKFSKHSSISSGLQPLAPENVR